MAEDFDNLSDEDFEKLLEDVENDAIDDVEDTDQIDDESDSEETEADTIEEDDDSFEETEDDEEEDDEDLEEENSHDIEDNDEESEDESTEEEDSEEEDEDSQPAAEEGMTEQEKIDYRKAYEQAIAEKQQYEDFYNRATAEYVANGKKMKGFTDPEKIIKAQQMAAGFDEKMRSFKQYRPFITPLKEKGILDNPDKFNLMLNAMSGDAEAIKKIIKDAELDPIELDMDQINYQPKNNIASNIELSYKDVIDSADKIGVKDRVEQVISKDWDDVSVVELLEDPQSSADLVSHLSSGIYDMVQERIAQKRMIDTTGAFSSKKMIEQYREAAKEIENEYIQAQQMQAENQPIQNEYQEAQDDFQFSEEEIQAEMDRIRAEKQNQASAKKRNAQADNGRKRAASVSKKKPRSRKKKQEFDPAAMSDDEFSAYLDSMIYTEE